VAIIFHLRPVDELGVLESFAFLNVHALHEGAGCVHYLLLWRFAIVVVQRLDCLGRGSHCTNRVDSLATDRITGKSTKALGIV